ncbi:hypothetical protein [Sphingomonas sp.]|uniref:hypothetical protein n=1 Tax=Sphingomonas sp. TaxID=28214 RepID=UPI0025EE2096|nr:hypothetical protein [Sphingomonas sp.]
MSGQGWQPIGTAPRDGTRFLAFGMLHGANDITVATYSSYYGLVTEPGRWVIAPTHWMPLPAAPVTA